MLWQPCCEESEAANRLHLTVADSTALDVAPSEIEIINSMVTVPLWMLTPLLQDHY